MKIYKLDKNYKYAEFTSNKELFNLKNEGFNGFSMSSKWGVQKMKWNFVESELKCDFPLLNGFIPVMSEKAKKCLYSLIPPDSVEFLPINVDDEMYYAINVLRIYTGIFKINKSKVDFFSDGRIMAIDKYVFKPHKNLSPIFKISELLVSTFVTDEFKEIVEREKLTGIKFVECKQSNSWF